MTAVFGKPCGFPFQSSSGRAAKAARFEEKIVKIHLLGALAVGLSAIGAPALAQDTETFNIRSTVSAFCSNLPATSEVDLEDLTGPDGLVLDAFAGNASHELAASYYCNVPSKLTLTALPLTHATITSVSDPSFTNRVDYDVRLTWTTAPNNSVSGLVSSTAATGVDILSTQARTGRLELQFSNPSAPGDRRPVAGGYVGSVQLTVAFNP